MSSVYLNANRIKYGKCDPSFSSLGDLFVFQDLSVVHDTTEENFEAGRDVHFADYLQNNFTTTSDDPVSLDRLYIKLDVMDGGGCMPLEDPLQNLVKGELNRSGKFGCKADDPNDCTHEYQFRFYEGVYYQNHSYSFPGNKKFDSTYNDINFPFDTLYIAYNRCFVACVKIKILKETDCPSVPAVDELGNAVLDEFGNIKTVTVYNYFYKNLLILEDIERTHIEMYCLSPPREGAKITIHSIVYPTLIRNSDILIHGKIEKSLDQGSNPTRDCSNLSRQDGLYASVCFFEDQQKCQAAKNTISCCLSSDGVTVDANSNSNPSAGTVSVNHNDEAFYSFSDSVLCPVGGTPSVVMVIIQLASIVENFYKNFSGNDCLVNIYAYNFKNIDYSDQNRNYTPFITNGEVQSATVILANQPLDLSKLISLRVNRAGIVTGLTFNFRSYKINTSDVDALNHSFDVPINVLEPTYEGVEKLSTGKIKILTRYATHIKYFFNWDTERFTVGVEDTLNLQSTEIDTSQKQGILYFTIYNYFVLYSNVYSISRSYAINAPVIIPNFQLRLFGDGDQLNFQNDAGLTDGTHQSLNINNCTQSSFSNYSLYSKRSVVDYKFELIFTLPANSTMKAAGPGKNLQEVQSGDRIDLELLERFTVPDTLTTIDVFVEKFSIRLLLNDAAFNIPFSFLPYAYAGLIAQGVVTKPLAITFTQFLFAKFSFEYRRAIQIEYEILDQSGGVIYGPISEKVRDSETFVKKTVTTGSLSTQGLTTLTAKIRITYRSGSSPYSNINVELTTNTVTNDFKKLHSTNPAEIEFYSNEGMTTSATNVVKAKPIYAFLQLRDDNNVKILVGNYSNYIHSAPSANSIFKILESPDNNVDLDKRVILTKKSEYSCSFIIYSNSSFDDVNLILQAEIDPIIQ